MVLAPTGPVLFEKGVEKMAVCTQKLRFNLIVGDEASCSRSRKTKNNNNKILFDGDGDGDGDDATFSFWWWHATVLIRSSTLVATTRKEDGRKERQAVGSPRHLVTIPFRPLSALDCLTRKLQKATKDIKRCTDWYKSSARSFCSICLGSIYSP